MFIYGCGDGLVRFDIIFFIRWNSKHDTSNQKEKKKNRGLSCSNGIQEMHQVSTLKAPIGEEPLCMPHGTRPCATHYQGRDHRPAKVLMQKSVIKVEYREL